MRIAVIGGGYVGLVSAACFAEFGMHVVVVETNVERISLLQQGHVPIYEPGLESMLLTHMQAGRLIFVDDLSFAVQGAEAVFIAVGTPPRKEDGAADMYDVHKVARQIAQALTNYTVIVTKSTVPVGSSRRIAEIIRQVRPDLEFDVASNPEFLREGRAIEDFMHPERVIIGLDTKKKTFPTRAEKVMRRVYALFDRSASVPLIFTSLETAELTKYASNSFLAIKISFINEMADLCEKLGANVQDLARGMGLDSRIGSQFLEPGPGYGGSCLPKDTLALSRIAQENHTVCRLVEAAVHVNEGRKASMAGRIITACGGVNGKVIAILGLTFKPGTDDMRESPAIPILHRLAEAGAVLQAYDPEGMKTAKSLLPEDIRYCEEVDTAIRGADALVIITDWDIFRTLSPQHLAQEMRGKIIMDLRNIFDASTMYQAGFDYHSIGRPLS